LRSRTVAALAWREYYVAGGLRALPVTVLLRALLEVWFLCTFSHYVAPQYDERMALVGAVGFAAVEPTISRMVEVIQPDRIQGTMYRLRLAQVSMFEVMAIRSWVYGLEGVAGAMVGGVVAGLIVQGPAGVRTVLAMTPFIVLLAAAAMCFGMFLAAVSLGRTVTPMIGNWATAVVLLVSGVVPISKAGGVLGAVGSVLPLREGLESARAATAGRDWMGLAGIEVLIAAAWLLLAAAVSRLQTRRALASGFDESD
jgi:ABC-type polysaccharide/polyol phosphate export permease